MLFLLSSIVIYIIKFNKFVFNKRYSLSYLGKYQDMKMEGKNGHWFLFITFYSIFKAVVYLELIIYVCLLNSKRIDDY